MIAIETTGHLTVFRATGTVAASEILTQAVQHLTGTPTKHAMWDFSQADGLQMTTLEMKGIADSLKQVVPPKAGGRVALVGSATINIGLGKLFAAFAQMADLPFRYKTFHHVAQAERWLADDSA